MRQKDGLVIVKVETPRAGELVYVDRRELAFKVLGDVPSELKKNAVATFKDSHGSEYTVISANYADRRTIVLLVRVGTKPLMQPRPPGWTLERPGRRPVG